MVRVQRRELLAIADDGHRRRGRVATETERVYVAAPRAERVVLRPITGCLESTAFLLDARRRAALVPDRLLVDALILAADAHLERRLVQPRQRWPHLIEVVVPRLALVDALARVGWVVGGDHLLEAVLREQVRDALALDRE
eukprot:7377354-Prymnesium_polylepis.1